MPCDVEDVMDEQVQENLRDPHQLRDTAHAFTSHALRVAVRLVYFIMLECHVMLKTSWTSRFRRT